ncbi:MAG TPA: ABC transporter ATP-binding protein [Ktedonobacteraceae bacterium]|nr:ABC transporter ATP-binding protein [Ktedonobacteraceae bacterium]
MVKPDQPAIEAGAGEPVLQLRNATFGYRRQPLLYDISLSIKAGEMVGLLGPNGSGKTTLLRLLSGVLQPQQGEVLLQGRALQQWGRRGVARRIAVVPQELHVPFAFTVEQMVKLGRTPFVSSFFGSPGKDDRALVQDAMSATGISSLGERIFNELSGGERQRVMIAMALAQQPVALLLDEPTSHLDIKYQIETLELVRLLNRERGVTVIAAMHDLNLAARYFPRLLLFQRGIVADAGPAEVLEPGLLSRVYGTSVQVGILRGAEHLSVLPPTSHASDKEREQRPQACVHLMAGGGSGELMMRALADAHIPFVAGALNVGDSDLTLALRLASEVIMEQPYAPIAPATLEQVRASLARVALLVLCPTPIGPGNLALLQEAVRAVQQGLPAIMLVTAVSGTGENVQLDLAARDYTGGQGQQLLEQLQQAGALVVESVGEALEVVKRKGSSKKL